MAEMTFDQAVIATADGLPLKVKLRQMWAGIREQISPTILAVATLLIVFSIALMTVIELLRRRNERLRGIRA